MNKDRKWLILCASIMQKLCIAIERRKMSKKNLGKWMLMILVMTFGILSFTPSRVQAVTIGQASVKVSSKSDSKIKVSVIPIVDANWYQYQIATDFSFNTVVKSKKSQKTEKSFTNLTAGTVYYIRVRAFYKPASGKKSFGSWSVTAAARTDPATQQPTSVPTPTPTTTPTPDPTPTPTPTPSTPTPTTTAASSGSTKLYTAVLSSYKKWEQSGFAAGTFNTALYGTVPEQAQLAGKGTVIKYRVFDFSKDGVDDLIVTINTNTGYFFEQLYTYNGASPVCLFSTGYWTSMGGPGFLVNITPAGLIHVQNRLSSNSTESRCNDYYQVTSQRGGAYRVAALTEVMDKSTNPPSYRYYCNQSYELSSKKLAGYPQYAVTKEAYTNLYTKYGSDLSGHSLDGFVPLSSFTG